jgi:cell wall-associated NlpC family hydrolase
VWDFFAEIGIQLPEFDHDETDDLNGTKIDVRALIRAANAEIVAEPKAGDIIVMITGASKRPNHLAVFMGDGTILHQTRGESRRDVFAGFWQRKMCYAVRVPRPDASIVETKPQGGALEAAEGTL